MAETASVRILLNGDERELPEAWTVADLLRDLKIESRFCAVELNGDVIPREQHSGKLLKPLDVVEVVTLVGGG